MNYMALYMAQDGSGWLSLPFTTTITTTTTTITLEAEFHSPVSPPFRNLFMHLQHRQDLILGADRDLLLVPWMPGLGAATEMHEWILHLLREMCDGGPLRRGQQLQPPQQGASNPQNKARKEDQARSGRTAVDATTGAHRQQSSGLEDSRAGKGGGSLGTREGAEVETFMKAAQQGKLPLRADWRIRRRIAMMVSISAMLDLCECEDAGHTLPESAQTMERLKSIKTLVMKTPPLLFVLDCAKGGGDIGILQTKQEVCVD
ncbi:hypothetical protein Vretifemale_13334 [Volvox reticuliferus]|uniref:Uncharacterized protein n=1 Tax=Volvox reticuliferus TaxID=1737510 RepID=A0A8J4CLE9_9CHLO|nr:hypothetical protein Vretifemale_13334 [Volvox reticuliferus]